MTDENDDEARAAVDEVVGTALSAMKAGMERHRPPPILYHLTNASGALGILTSKTLWASRAMSLNDSSEIAFGIDLTRRYLMERIEKERSPKREIFLKHALDWLLPTPEQPDLVINIEHFVVSFCGDVGRSSHWLHYGNVGAGYALGFESARLEAKAFELVKVIYDAEEQIAVIDQAVKIVEEKLLDVTYRKSVDTLAAAGGVASHLCATAIRALTARLKHPSFSSEDEWRLVTMNFSNMTLADGGVPLKQGYLARGSRIIPYLTADYASGLPISEIVLGQAVDLEHARGALQYLFREQEIVPAPSIRQTEVPVRPNF